MAEAISKIIFELDVKAQAVFSELEKVASKYKETTTVVKTQQAAIDALVKKEVELTSQRAKASNPSAIVKINKELKNTQDLLAKEIAQQKLLNKELDKQEDTADGLAIKLQKAYEETILKSFNDQLKNTTSESKKFGDTTETNIQKLKRLNRELQELDPGTQEFVDLAKEAGEVRDKITTAANSVQVFSAASKATQAKTLFHQILDDLGELNFADAANKAKQFSSVVSSISLKEIISGAKEFGSTMLNVGKTLLTNPLVLFAAAIAGISYAIYSVVQSYRDFATSSQTVDDYIKASTENIIELQRRQADALITTRQLIGQIDEQQAKSLRNDLKNKDEKLKLAQDLKEKIVVLAKEQEIELTSIRNGRTPDTFSELGNDVAVKRAKKFNREFRRLTDEFNKRSLELQRAQILEEINIQKQGDKEKLSNTISLQRQIEDAQINLIKNENERAEARINIESARRKEDLKKINADEQEKIELTELIEQERRQKIADLNKSLRKEIEDAQIKIINDERQRQLAQIRIDAQRQTEDVKKLRASEEEKTKLIILIELERQKKVADLDDIRLKRVQQSVNKEREIRSDGLQQKLDENQLAQDHIKHEQERAAEEAKLRKQKVAQDIEALNVVVQASAQAAEQVIAIEIKKQDQLIDIQNRRVAAAEKIAERGNAEVLQQEQERLDELQKKREAFVKQQQILQQIEILGNVAVAITKAASQTGVAAPIAIATTIAAIVGGLAAIAGIAQAAQGFKEGGYTGDGDPSQESRALGNRGYKYHRKEFIFNEGLTKENLSTFRKIHRGEMDLNSTVEKARLFDSLPMPILNNLLLGSAMRQAQNNVDTSRMENIMSDGFKALKNKPNSALHISEKGFRTYLEQMIYEDNRINLKAR